MDIAWTSLRHIMNNKVMDFWELLFTQAPAESRTIELTMARQRYIFTADPENARSTGRVKLFTMLGKTFWVTRFLRLTENNGKRAEI